MELQCFEKEILSYFLLNILMSLFPYLDMVSVKMQF